MSKFLEDPHEENPYVFIQYKGTDICMDFHCECGAHCHFDGYFAYAVKCPHCDAMYEMPPILIPRRVGPHTYQGHVEDAKLMERDEDVDDGTDEIEEKAK